MPRSRVRDSILHPTRHRTGPLLLAGDAAAMTAVVLVVHARPDPVTISVVVTATVSYLLAAGMYRSRLTLSVLNDLPALTLGTVVGTTAHLVFSPEPFAGRIVALYVAALVAGLVAERTLAYAFIRAVRRHGVVRHRTLIYGAGDRAVALSTTLYEHPELGLDVLGLVDDEPPRQPTLVPWLGGLHQLGDLMRQHGTRELVVAVDDAQAAEVAAILRTCERLDCHVFLATPADYLSQAAVPRLDEAWGIPLLRYSPGLAGTKGRLAKRGLDIAVAGLGLLLTLPVLLVVAAAVRLEGGPGVLFRQDRVGLGERTFTLLKFRSMRPADTTESNTTWNVTGDARIGPVGRFIRRTSLDELPQLWNVLRGQMSLVGPRPERPHFVNAFSETVPLYQERHRMPVGLTGWAQVHGLRGDTSVIERAKFDYNYIQSWSLWMDAKILIRTVSHVIGATFARRTSAAATTRARRAGSRERRRRWAGHPANAGPGFVGTTTDGDAAAAGSSILHVSQAVEAGVAHVIADLVRAQTRAGLDVVVACPRGDLQDLARDAGARVTTWSAARGPGPGTLAELQALSTVLRDVRPALVHLHSSQAGLVGRLLIRGTLPTVFTPHAWSWQPMAGPARSGAVAWERLAARWSHAIVCVSEDERQDGRKHRVAGALTVIPNGVQDDLAAQIDHVTQAAARRVLGLNEDADLVVCCARLAEQKGQAHLLRAWSRVVDERPGSQLVLVGDGPQRAELELAARDLPGVAFVGWRPRVECLQWMRAATLVVCPSRYEAMSLVPLEAAALGTPVVATRVDGMTAAMSPSARRMVEPGDPDVLAVGLLELLRDRDALRSGSEEAVAWARRQATEQSPGSQYLDLYCRLLGRIPALTAA